MKRCGVARLHAPHGECDGGSDYFDFFEPNEQDYERGMYFEQDEDDHERMSATEQYLHPENR